MRSHGTQAWLYRAARNAIVDQYRKRRRVITLEDAHERIDRVAGGRDTAEPVAAVQELARCLRPLIDELPDDYRSALTLVDLDGTPTMPPPTQPGSRPRA